MAQANPLTSRIARSSPNKPRLVPSPRRASPFPKVEPANRVGERARGLQFRPLATVVFLTIINLVSASTPAGEPEITAKDLPRVSPVLPADAPETLRLRKGFHAELCASEPQIASPVAMAFDEDSRLYVVEMRDYPFPELRDQKLGRIRLLESSKGDGLYDKSTVFADGLGWPTAIIPWDGGVFVGCTPDIWYMKDTDGDGVADVKRIVYTGFAAGQARLNVQGLLNSFNWGLDNRIHGAASTSGGKVVRVQGSGFRVREGKDEGRRQKNEAMPLELRGKGFVFDPRSGSIEAENGGGQHGLSFDDWGHLYLCSNSRHLLAFAYDAKYAAGNSLAPMPPPLLDIPVDGPAAEVYRASPEEPWRVIRTKWRVSGLVPGPIEGGGRSAGYFTGATGAVIYRGDAYGPDFAGDAFIGDAGGNLVHRKKIRASGAIVKAERPADEQTSEFLASTDTWFRPVQMANGPDGCLYVIDMYRETIEHPWSLPDNMKKYLDLTSGRDRGRIWRVVADGWKRPPQVKLAKATVAELVAQLASTNGWTRDTAARLICARQDRGAMGELEKLINDSSPLGVLHGLHALDGLGALKSEHALLAMNHTDPRLRCEGVRLAEKLIGGPADANAASAKLLPKVFGLAGDPSIDVRYQVALTLSLQRSGAADEPAEITAISALAKIAAVDAKDPWVSAAVMNAASAGGRAIALFKAIDGGGKDAPARAMLPKLAEVVGARAEGAEGAEILDAAASDANAAEMMLIARSFAAGARRAGVALDAVKAAGIIDKAADLAADEKADPSARAAAASVLGYTAWNIHSADLLKLLEARQPPEVQAAALAGLDMQDEGDLAGLLIGRWKELPPKLREAAAALMVKRPARAKALLQAVNEGKIRPSELSGSQVSALRQSSDRAVKDLVGKVMKVPEGRREDVVKTFSPAMELAGDAKRGQAIYLSKCSTCHRIAGQGNALGPDLETVRNSGKDKLLTNILDPNREVAASFMAFIVETSDGDSQVGIIISETPAAVTLRMAGGMESTISRAQIKSMRSAGQSMMPEGLEEGMSKQDLADLMEYVLKP